MKEIKLTQGKVALVDDEDYDFLVKWKWFALSAPHTFYAIRHGYNTKHSFVYMHRQI